MSGITPENDLLPELLARLASGDRGALQPTFRILYPIIRRFCEKTLGVGPDAEDATQQTLEKLFEQVATYDATRHVLPWVFTIAAWEVKTIRRRAWRGQQRAGVVPVDELVGGQPDPESSAMSKEFLAAIDELIEALPTNDRLTMRETMERELNLVAASPADATFRKRKERALQKLRSLLRNLGHVQ